MNARLTVIGCGLALWIGMSGPVLLAGPADSSVRQHAEQTFQLLEQQELQTNPPSNRRDDTRSSRSERPPLDHPGKYPSEQYLIGQGQGDLAKGKIVCQRVSELAARADLAKQIRVLVKEHAIDRVRERTGHNPEQDIEVIREEIVQEYLQGVKIVDRRIDESGGACTSTAVMSKGQIAPRSAPDTPEPTPIITR